MSTLFAGLRHDLRYSVRQLRKTPGLALLAILTLALGVGGNTAIFTVIESVLLRPLPYAHANRLVAIGEGGDKASFGTTSWLNYRDIRDQSHLLAAVAGYSQDVSVLQTADASESVLAPRVTPNLFSLLGARPLLGRTFSEAEGQSGGRPVVLLSEGLWRQSFHADAGIVGKTATIGGRSYTIIGVLPQSFRFPDAMGSQMNRALWLPLQPTAEMLNDRGYKFFNVLGRLGPGATVAQVQQELNSIAAHIPRDKGETPQRFQAASYQDVLTGQVKPVLYALFAALGLVLLIACANVSNLLIARCLGRQQEFAVRAALGAGRIRLMRQMLSEGLVLSLLGCGVGFAFAQLAMMAVEKLPPDTIPRGNAVGLHWTVLLTLAAIAIVTTVLSSLLPGVLVARANPQAVLQSASRGVGSHAVSRRITGSLVAGEVALSTLLLVCTGLLFHTLRNLEQAHLGFDAARVTEFQVMPADAAGFSAMSVSKDTGHAPVSVAALVYQPILERIRHVPGVESAALVTTPPFSGMGVSSSFTIVGQPDDKKAALQTDVTAISDDYARVLSTPMRRGRMIDDGDAAAAPFVAVINETFAKKFFAASDPLGKQINLGGKGTGMIEPFTIVGVLGDQADKNVGGAIQPLIFLPQQQIPTTSLFYQALLKTEVNFLVKARGSIPVAAEMRSVFHASAPGYALDNFQTMQEAVEQNTFSQRLGLFLLGSFAGLAIVMVVAGLYGVLSQLVSYRRREIGVRMALGATRASVARLVLRQGSILVGAGLGCGLLLALATGRLVKSFLYEVHPLDGWTYAAVILALAAIGLAAALIPASRAASIQPIQALRED
jgi:predicted permease